MSEWFPPGTSWLESPPVGGLPDGPWPIGSPESQGMSSAILGSANGIQYGVVIRNGVEVYTYGDAGKTLDWASCNRTLVDKLWGKWVMQNGMMWLDRLVADLPCDAAHVLPNPDAYLKNVCSYTSLPPVGQVWRYSSGDWWPWQAQALSGLFGTADVAGAWDAQLQPHLGGSTFRSGIADDGTLRVKGSCRDMARMGMLMLNGGIGTHGTRLCDSAYIAGGMAGGPNWDGVPFKWEGMQTHLIREHKCNAGSSQNSPQWVDLPGVPDGGMALDGNTDLDHGWGAIVAIPSLDLIVSARGSTPAWWLPTISSACS